MNTVKQNSNEYTADEREVGMQLLKCAGNATEMMGGTNNRVNGDATTNNMPAGNKAELPEPSPSPSGVVCLRGELSKEQQQHRIAGLWSLGLNMILDDPDNSRGLCNCFRYEQKKTADGNNSDSSPSGQYTGWFDFTQGNGSRVRVPEKDVDLIFVKNNAGYFNVSGRGSNRFGVYRISGTLTTDNVITIFRHFEQQPGRPIITKDGSNKTTVETTVVKARRQPRQLPRRERKKRHLLGDTSSSEEEKSFTSKKKKPRIAIQIPKEEGAPPRAMAVTTTIATTNVITTKTGGDTPVTRKEFDDAIQMIRQLQDEIIRMGGTLPPITSALARKDDVMAAAKVKSPSRAKQQQQQQQQQQKKKPTKKVKPAKKATSTKSAVQSSRPLTIAAPEKPLTAKEQEELVEAFNKLRSDQYSEVMRIIRESSTKLVDGDDDEIDLELDQLDTITQRKLHRLVVKKKRNYRKKAQTKKKQPVAAHDAAVVKTEKESQQQQSTNKPKTQSNNNLSAKKKEKKPKSNEGRFFSFEEDNTDVSIPTLHDENDGADNETFFEFGSNKKIEAQQHVVTNAYDDDEDDKDDVWSAAKVKSDMSKVREAEHNALKDKVYAAADTAKNERLADAKKDADKQKIEEQKEEAQKVAKVREDARKNNRVVQTYFPDEQAQIMKEMEQSFCDGAGGRVSSPLSDFGF